MIYYFKKCCVKLNEPDNYFGVNDLTLTAPILGNVYAITIPSFSGCATLINGPIPSGSLIYDAKNGSVVLYPDCSDCIENAYSCFPPPPPQPAITYIQSNECNVITLFPMTVECEVINPSTFGGRDGRASISITGGTPPYTITWADGSVSPAIMDLEAGSYPATIVDYWGDFTANTICELLGPTPPPTSTPTPTPTLGPTATPGPTPTMTPTATPNIGPTATPGPTPTLGPTATPTPTLTPTQVPTFVSVWETTTSMEPIVLPYSSSGTYTGTIDWGDGFTSANTFSNRAHVYEDPGEYTVTITGTLNYWSFNANTPLFPANKDKIIDILEFGPLQININAAFSGCTNLKLNSVTDTPNITSPTAASYMFDGCTSLTQINLSNNWNVSGMTTFVRMFNECTSFNSNISNWNVSNCRNFSRMFFNCYLFNNGQLPGDASPGMNNWQIPITSPTNILMVSMFEGCRAFNQTISSWNVIRVPNMSRMFFDCRLFNSPLSNWERTSPDTSSLSGVTNMNSMFKSAHSFNQDIGDWNLSSLTRMSEMFMDAVSFNNGGNSNINNLNVTNVTRMDGLFSRSLSTLSAMTFNQNIGDWLLNSNNVDDISGMFENSDAFNNGGSSDINNWNMSNITVIDNLFNGATSFNQNIGNWDISGLNSLNSMFKNATSFNNGGSPNINNWDTTNVTSMFDMFNTATSFNQDLSGWCVSFFISQPTGFDTGATSWTGGTATRPQWGATC